MKAYHRLLIFLFILSLVVITAGCSDSADSDNSIRGHVTLSNTPVDSLATNQSTTENIRSNVKGIKDSSPSDHYVEDEIIVSFKESADVESILKKYGLSIKNSVKELGVNTLTGVGNRDINSLVEELNNEAEVSYAELNKIVRIMAVEVNDPDYSTKQWNYSAISLPKAWELNTGSSEVTVAVIDTGISLGHPDLKNHLVEGIDLVDYESDSNSNVIAYDEDNFPGADDRNGHGTHVAGVIGATTNNGIGIAGINWNISLMPIRVLDSDGKGNNQTIAAGIVWAVNHGADIINLSVGSSEGSAALKDAIDYAYNAGVTVIAASGNGGLDTIGDDKLIYPAAYKNTIAVGSIGSSLQLSEFSNYGEGLDFVAPGEDIYSTYGRCYLLDGQIHYIKSYKNDSGTSMATPHVVGVAALILAKTRATGDELSPAELKEELRLTAQDLGDKDRDDKYGYGLINAYAAVADAKITKAKIFAGEESNNKIELKSEIVNLKENGVYELNDITEGNYYIYCWIDLDKEGEAGYNIIDRGDYFARTSSRVGSGNNTDLELTLITGDNFKELEVTN